MRKLFGKFGLVFIAAAMALQLSPATLAVAAPGSSSPIEISEILKATPDGDDVSATGEFASDGTNETASLDEVFPIAEESSTAIEADPEPQTELATPEEQPAPSQEELAALAEDALAQKVDTLDPAELGYMPGELIIAYKNDVPETAADDAVDIVEGTVGGVVAELNETTLATVSIPEDVDPEAAAAVVEQDDRILYAEPNYYFELSATEAETIAESEANAAAEAVEKAVAANDTGSLAIEATADSASATLAAITNDKYISELWHLSFVNAPAAWNTVKANRASTDKVRVAILDTGANFDHEDLSGIVNKKLSAEVIIEHKSDGPHTHTEELRGDGYLNGKDKQLTSYHGTHVCGIVAAKANNGKGVAGVGSGGSVSDCPIEIIAIDVFSSSSNGRNEGATSAEIVAGLSYAKEAGCKVANMSMEFPSTFDSSSVKDAIQDFTDAENNGTVVCAAGNDGANKKVAPGSLDNTIGVMNCTRSGTRHYSSNFGTWYDLYAPGDSIYSTTAASNKSYGYMTGTSMASPVVAATVAMMYAVNPSIKFSDVQNVLRSTKTSKGYLNANAAVSSVIRNMNYVEISATGMARNYTGAALQPDITITHMGKTLIKGTDYDVVCTDATGNTVALPMTKPGSANITIKGKNGYDGEKSLGTFTIHPAPSGLQGAVFSLACLANESMVLDATGAVPKSGANITAWTSNGGANQSWTFALGSDGFYTIASRANPDLVLDAAGATPRSGANVSAYESNGGSNQKWVLVPDDETGSYAIASASDPTLVLDAAGAVPKLGANISIYASNGGKNQKWLLQDRNINSGA